MIGVGRALAAAAISRGRVSSQPAADRENPSASSGGVLAALKAEGATLGDPSGGTGRRRYPFAARKAQFASAPMLGALNPWTDGRWPSPTA
jgi:hypothetical protein